MFSVTVHGLRDLRGRFTSVQAGGLAAIQIEEANALAAVLEDIYRRRAPRSPGTAQGRGHFFEGLNGRALAAGAGFRVAVDTDKPDLAGWLRTGTRPHEIRPRNKLALFWPQASHPVRVVHHPGTKANPWEREAELEGKAIALEIGRRIGQRVTFKLAGLRGL